MLQTLKLNYDNWKNKETKDWEDRLVVGVAFRPRVNWINFSLAKSQSYQTLISSFFPIFAFRLGLFKVQTIFYHATNTQA